MESCPAQAVLPLVGLAADKIIRDRYSIRSAFPVKATRLSARSGKCHPTKQCRS
ncbi:MAG: hypothetical protein ACQESR_07600 [Planctomycetota bacterium]